MVVPIVYNCFTFPGFFDTDTRQEIFLINLLKINAMRKPNLVRAIKEFLAGTVSKICMIIFGFGFFSLGTLANPHLATKQQIGMFKNSKTCVVLENGIISFNLPIKDAVQKYWKSTEFEFIDEQEFENRRHDSKYSFIVLMKGVYSKDPGGVSYNYLSLVLGDEAYDMTEMPELCSIPLSYTNDIESDYDYAIPAIIQFMQKHTKNLEKNRFLI
jgi:hypothetical protein